MSEVQVTINDRSYRIGCDDGQEDHVKALAQALNARVSELVATAGQIGDNRLLVMAGILLADDLGEALTELDSREQVASDDTAAAEQALADGVEALADRIEKVAERLEQS